MRNLHPPWFGAVVECGAVEGGSSFALDHQKAEWDTWDQALGNSGSLPVAVRHTIIVPFAGCTGEELDLLLLPLIQAAALTPLECFCGQSQD